MPSTENKLDSAKSNASTSSVCKKTIKPDLSKGTVKNHVEIKEVETSNINRNNSSVHKKSVTNQLLKTNFSKTSANAKGFCCKNILQKKKTAISNNNNSNNSNKSLPKHSASNLPKTKKVAKIASKKNSASDKSKKINGLKSEPKANGLKVETKVTSLHSRMCSSESKKVTTSSKSKEGKKKSTLAGDKVVTVCKTNTASQSKKSLPKKNKQPVNCESDCETKRKHIEVEIPVEKVNSRSKNSNSCTKLNAKEKISLGKYTINNNAKTVNNKPNKSALFKSSCVIQKSLQKTALIKKGLQSLKNMFGYWNGSRLKRVASLNALAKVHILYENEVRNPSDSERDENSSPKRSDSPVSDNLTKIVTFKKKRAIKIAQKNNQTKSLESKNAYKKSKESKKGKVANTTREIITCRRMASLNAQAILAASYSTNRPRRHIKVEFENKQLKDEQRTTNSNGKQNIIVVKRQKIKTTLSSVSRTENVLKKQCESFPKKKKESHQKIGSKEKKQKCLESLTRMSRGSISEKHSDSEGERECSEKVEDKAEVTITGVYINPTTNASFCISRVQTYKQSQTYSPPPSPPPSQGQTAVHVQPTPHMMGSVLSSSAHMPTGIYSFPNSMMPSSSNQSYPINGISNVPLVNVALPRHYSSAFTVPHYGHHAPITYTHGFYQPAGPLIQTITDPCLIHKPVPYHPHLQQTPSNIYPQERCQSHTTPPQTLQYPHDQCPTHPTPPYSSQPCTQTKCPTIPPAPSSSHFPQDQCHSHPSPQEGFFPEHCPGQAVGTQVYHMPQSFQPNNGTSAYKPLSSCYPEKSENCVQAPTLHVQPKTEQMLMKEENPLQPPVLTPIKPLKLNYEGRILESKAFEGNLQKTGENHNTKHHAKTPVSEKQMPVSSEASAPAEISSQKKTKGDSRQLRLEVKTHANHERQSLPCKRKCMKLLRNEDQNCKRKRLIIDNGENKFVQKTRFAVYKKSRYSVPQNRCINNSVSVKRSKTESHDVVNERTNSIPSKTSDHVLPRVGRKPSTGNKTQDQKNAGSHAISTSIVRPVGRSKIHKKNPKFSNGWTWEGEAFDQQIQSHNDDSAVIRKCYPAMRHIEGDIIKCRDCVLLKSGPRKNDLPFVAKIAALWENPDDGEMMISLLWYYRPEHTEQGRKPHHMEDEIFASKHKDVNSVACIEDKCYVLTFNEYCRYRRRVRLLEEGLRPQTSVVPDPEEGYPRKDRQPPGCVSPDMVFFCRKVYDFRQKRILKNPS